MITRMERATATWALALPRRRAIRPERQVADVVVSLTGGSIGAGQAGDGVNGLT
jgi:hypothetical protein